MQQSGRGVTARAPGPAVQDEEDFSYDGAVSRVQEALGKGGKHGKLLQALRALTAHAIDAPTLHALCHFLSRDPASKDERKAFRAAHYFVVRWIHLASADERGRLVEVLRGPHGIRSPHLPTRLLSLRTFAALDASHGLALSRVTLADLTPQLVAVRDPDHVCRRVSAPFALHDLASSRCGGRAGAGQTQGLSKKQVAANADAILFSRSAYFAAARVAGTGAPEAPVDEALVQAGVCSPDADAARAALYAALRMARRDPVRTARWLAPLLPNSRFVVGLPSEVRGAGVRQVNVADPTAAVLLLEACAEVARLPPGTAANPRPGTGVGPTLGPAVWRTHYLLIATQTADERRRVALRAVTLLAEPALWRHVHRTRVVETRLVPSVDVAAEAAAVAREAGEDPVAAGGGAKEGKAKTRRRFGLRMPGRGPRPQAAQADLPPQPLFTLVRVALFASEAESSPTPRNGGAREGGGGGGGGGGDERARLSRQASAIVKGRSGAGIAFGRDIGRGEDSFLAYSRPLTTYITHALKACLTSAQRGGYDTLARLTLRALRGVAKSCLRASVAATRVGFGGEGTDWGPGTIGEEEEEEEEEEEGKDEDEDDEGGEEEEEDGGVIDPFGTTDQAAPAFSDAGAWDIDDVFGLGDAEAPAPVEAEAAEETGDLLSLDLLTEPPPAAGQTSASSSSYATAAAAAAAAPTASGAGGGGEAPAAATAEPADDLLGLSDVRDTPAPAPTPVPAPGDSSGGGSPPQGAGSSGQRRLPRRLSGRAATLGAVDALPVLRAQIRRVAQLARSGSLSVRRVAFEALLWLIPNPDAGPALLRQVGPLYDFAGRETHGLVRSIRALMLRAEFPAGIARPLLRTMCERVQAGPVLLPLLLQVAWAWANNPRLDAISSADVLRVWTLGMGLGPDGRATVLRELFRVLDLRSTDAVRGGAHLQGRVSPLGAATALRRTDRGGRRGGRRRGRGLALYPGLAAACEDWDTDAISGGVVPGGVGALTEAGHARGHRPARRSSLREGPSVHGRRASGASVGDVREGSRSRAGSVGSVGSLSSAEDGRTGSHPHGLGSRRPSLASDADAGADGRSVASDEAEDAGGETAARAGPSHSVDDVRSVVSAEEGGEGGALGQQGRRHSRRDSGIDSEGEGEGEGGGGISLELLRQLREAALWFLGRHADQLTGQADARASAQFADPSLEGPELTHVPQPAMRAVVHRLHDLATLGASVAERRTAAKALAEVALLAQEPLRSVVWDLLLGMASADEADEEPWGRDMAPLGVTDLVAPTSSFLRDLYGAAESAPSLLDQVLETFAMDGAAAPLLRAHADEFAQWDYGW